MLYCLFSQVGGVGLTLTAADRVVICKSILLRNSKLLPLLDIVLHTTPYGNMYKLLLLKKTYIFDRTKAVHESSLGGLLQIQPFLF